MGNIVKYKDIYAFHPGFYAKEIFEFMRDNKGLTKANFASEVGTTEEEFDRFLDGRLSVDGGIARGLSMMSGTSEKMWYNLQNSFDMKLEKIESRRKFDMEERNESLLKNVVSYFIKDSCGLAEAREKLHEIGFSDEDCVAYGFPEVIDMNDV